VYHHGTSGVDQQPQGRNARQAGALHGLRVAKPQHRLEHDPPACAKEQQGAEPGRHHLRSGEAEAVSAADGADHQDQRPQCDAQPGDVGDQVGRIGKQCQRPEDDPAGNLDDQQGGVDAQGPSQRAPLPRSADVAVMLECVLGDLTRRLGYTGDG
jgi:hypothetical protein